MGRKRLRLDPEGIISCLIIVRNASPEQPVTQKRGHAPDWLDRVVQHTKPPWVWLARRQVAQV